MLGIVTNRDREWLIIGFGDLNRQVRPWRIAPSFVKFERIDGNVVLVVEAPLQQG